jgi:hypothetical protein
MDGVIYKLGKRRRRRKKKCQLTNVDDEVHGLMEKVIKSSHWRSETQPRGPRLTCRRAAGAGAEKATRIACTSTERVCFPRQLTAGHCTCAAGILYSAGRTIAGQQRAVTSQPQAREEEERRSNMPHTLLIEASSGQYAQRPIRALAGDAETEYLYMLGGFQRILLGSDGEESAGRSKRNLSNERFVVLHMVPDGARLGGFC